MARSGSVSTSAAARLVSADALRSASLSDWAAVIASVNRGRSCSVRQPMQDAGLGGRPAQGRAEHLAGLMRTR